MEDKMGDEILKTSLEDWDEHEDYNQESGYQLKATRLAFMVLKRDTRKRSAQEQQKRTQPIHK